jgi:hypothetical protein
VFACVRLFDVAHLRLFPAFSAVVNSATMHPMMFWDFMIGFTVELLRLLLLEELSERVRRGVTRLHRIRLRKRAKSVYRTLERNRKRELLHRLIAPDDEIAS